MFNKYNNRTITSVDGLAMEKHGGTYGLIGCKAALSHDQYRVNYSVSLINIAVQISARRYISARQWIQKAPTL